MNLTQIGCGPPERLLVLAELDRGLRQGLPPQRAVHLLEHSLPPHGQFHPLIKYLITNKRTKPIIIIKLFSRL